MRYFCTDERNFFRVYSKLFVCYTIWRTFGYFYHIFARQLMCLSVVGGMAAIVCKNYKGYINIHKKRG